MKNKKFDIRNFIPANKKMMVAAIAVLVIELLFMVLLLMVNLLPIKFLAVIIIGLLAIDIAILWLLGNKKSANKRLVGLICSVIVVSVSFMGCWYMYSTYEAFAKIIGFTQYEYYDVLVLKDTNYKEIEDIDGKEVAVLNTKDKSYQEAVGKLNNAVTIKTYETADIMESANLLIDEDGNKQDNIIFLSDANYSMACEEIEGYKKQTKVLYRVKVETKSDDSASKVNVTEDSFNIYVSGIDVWGEIEQVSRSDVNMLVTVNPKTRQILLTSIPRDAYVPLHSVGQMDKLTHSGVYGIDETLLTVEDWLGVHSDFYVRANFSMLVRLVAAVGCVDVYSDYAFKSSISECEYTKGWNHLTGRKALYFARERKVFVDNDQQRVKNQQKVVKAIIDKATQSEVLLLNYTDILDAVAGYMQTNLSNKNISALAKMQLNDMKTGWTINSISIRGKMDKQGTYSMGPLRPLDVCIMNEDSVKRAQELINQVMYPVDDQVVEIEDDKSENGLVDKDEAPGQEQTQGQE